jgi:hypothetical protein
LCGVVSEGLMEGDLFRGRLVWGVFFFCGVVSGDGLDGGREVTCVVFPS